MRGGVTVQRNHPRSSMLFRRIGEETLRGGYITPFAQEKNQRFDPAYPPRDTGKPIGPLS
jgi:hypothetical protein